MARNKLSKLEPRETDWLSDVQHYASLAVEQLKNGETESALGTMSWIESKLYAVGHQGLTAAGRIAMAKRQGRP